jgi:hypothetical protein
VQHNEADIDRLIENFAVFARAAGPATGGLVNVAPAGM